MKQTLSACNMPGTVPGTVSPVTNKVNTITILELAVHQHVAMALDSTEGPRCIYDVHGECSQHSEFEMFVK